MKRFLLLSAILTTFLLSSDTAYAGASINISPATGTFSQNVYADIVINNSGDVAYGYDLDLTYSGPISYVSKTNGELGCDPTVTAESNKISIVCLAPPTGSPPGLGDSGVLVRLVFKTTGVGTSMLSLDVVDSDVTVDSVVGSTYQISGASSTNTNGYQQLPSTGFLDSIYVRMGVALLISSVVFFYKFKKMDYFNQDANLTNRSMNDKVNNS